MPRIDRQPGLTCSWITPDRKKPVPDPGPSMYQCDQCDKEFDTSKGASMHVTKVHGRPDLEPED